MPRFALHNTEKKLFRVVFLMPNIQNVVLGEGFLRLSPSCAANYVKRLETIKCGNLIIFRYKRRKYYGTK